MPLELPDYFVDILHKKFLEAIEVDSLKFTESVTEDIQDGDLTYRVRIAPSLGLKPVQTAAPPFASSDTTSKAKFDPFANPESSLFLCPLGVNEYYTILNKFSIIPHHFLLITKSFESQNAPLSEEDLEATWACLQPTIDRGMRTLAFYNCGEASGASQSHRHVQFIPVPEQFKLLPDIALSYGVQPSKNAIGVFPTYHPGASFAHYVLPIPPNPTADDLIMRFATLLARALTVLRTHEQSPISFNFAMTKEWMFIAPRRQELYEGVSVNTTGMVGLMLAKSHEQLDLIKRLGPSKILANVGLPKAEGDEQHHDY
ncbi:ATP adenylyltransferase-domain-containing protein [Limtongia smithiae]|uniref:ATP adenylyltransferase-domain-containing protein n=1 Tax=Limtongia smithiae TaxID=1125753 RepID=UPI0034D016BF